MRNFIKGALCASAVFTLMSVTAYAETNIVPKVDANNHVTITVETDNAQENIYTFMVYKPGSDELDNCYKLETAIGADGAQASFNVKATDPTGKYSVAAGGGEIKGVKAFFVIASNADKAEAFAAIKGATAGNAESILTRYNNKVWLIDLNNKYYTSDKTNVMKSFVNFLPSNPASSADVEEAFRKACALSEISQASADGVTALLQKHCNLLGAAFSEVMLSGDAKINTAFVNLAKDEGKNPLNSVAQLETLARKAEALGMMNGANRENCLARLKMYASDLGITVSNDVDEFELVKQLVNSSAAPNDKSIEDFQKRYEAAVIAAKEITDSKPSIKGNGGGKGGGGSISAKIDSSLVPQNIAEAAETLLSDDASVFSDVATDNWARKYIEYIASKEIMSGDGDGTFRPDDSITREEFLKTAMCGLGADVDMDVAPGVGMFDDVAQEDWFCRYVRIASATGIITGIDDKNFGVGMPISRQDAAVIIMRVKELCSLPFVDSNEEFEFSDATEIADYAADAVKKLQVSGILNGDENGAYRPQDNLSRAETAKIIYSVLKNIKSL